MFTLFMCELWFSHSAHVGGGGMQHTQGQESEEMQHYKAARLNTK